MKIKYLFMPLLITGVVSQSIAADCSTAIDANDAMKYDKNEIVIDKSCEEFIVNLAHSGKLAKNVMGHNVVIAKATDAATIASDAISAGLENQYVKPGDERVIAFTNIIGGGEKTSTTFNVGKLKVGESYVFFCSFPGHIAIMKGVISIK